MSTVKMIFPDGIGYSNKSRKTIYQSCYIALSENSLDKHMLTFAKYSEEMPPEFAIQYNHNNFRKYSKVFGERVIGIISAHHDNQAAEKLLQYLLEYIKLPVVPLPVEVD